MVRFNPSPLRFRFELDLDVRRQGSRHTLPRPIATGTGLHILAAMTLGERRDAMGHPVDWLTRFVAAVVFGMAMTRARG
jgi:hypothetical protein